MAGTGADGGILAQEIRNPLAPCGSIQMLRHEMKASRAGRADEIILRESDRLKSISTDF